MESTDSFRTTAFSIPAQNNPAVYPEVECDQGGLFQVKISKVTLAAFTG